MTRTRYAIWFAVALVVALCFSRTQVAVAQEGSGAGLGEGVPTEFSDSTFVTSVGRATGDGGCVFKGYRLTLPPGEKAVAARQVSVDYTTCTELIEVGTPREEPDTTPTGGFSEGSEPAREPTRPKLSEAGGATALAGTTKSVRYEVWWEDVINADVTKTWAKLTFTALDGCVYNSSGSGYYWWRSGTGWSKVSSKALLYRPTYGWCVPTPDQPTRSRSAYTEVDSKFKNGIFCAGFDTWNYYENVTVKGYYDGGVIGWVDNTWVDEPALCPPLHWHSKLVS